MVVGKPNRTPGRHGWGRVVWPAEPTSSSTPQYLGLAYSSTPTYVTAVLRPALLQYFGQSTSVLPREYYRDFFGLAFARTRSWGCIVRKSTWWIVAVDVRKWIQTYVSFVEATDSHHTERVKQTEEVVVVGDILCRESFLQFACNKSFTVFSSMSVRLSYLTAKFIPFLQKISHKLSMNN